jgi:hypothetical protein
VFVPLAHGQSQLELFKAVEIRSRRSIDFSTNPAAADLVRKKQLDWHARNSACLFARKLYKDPENFKFKVLIVDNGSGRFLSEKAIEFCKTAIEESVRTQEIEALSMIFPHVRDLDTLKNFVEIFCKELNFKIEVKKYIEFCQGYGLVDGISMRLPIHDNDVHAWPMAVGDFIFFPETRKAPYFEFLLRTKIRPENAKSEIKLARSWEAHLADIPLDAFSQNQFTKMWDGSKEKKE